MEPILTVATRNYGSVDEVRRDIGREIGVSTWFHVTQDVVTAFAELTGDHEWIHVDVERAAAGPFGSTIAHGYLTLSLIPRFAAEVFRFDFDAATLNYGVEKVRFPTPLLTESRVHARVSVTRVDEHAAGTAITFAYVLETEGGTKPACVADTVLLVLGAT